MDDSYRYIARTLKNTLTFVIYDLGRKIYALVAKRSSSSCAMRAVVISSLRKSDYVPDCWTFALTVATLFEQPRALGGLATSGAFLLISRIGSALWSLSVAAGS